MNSRPDPPQPSAGKGKGCGLALAIGALTIVVVSVTFSVATGSPLNLREELGVFLFQTLIVAAPFGVLSLAGIFDRMSWAVGLALTAAFWGYYLFEGITYQLSDDMSGVNFASIFLLMWSPVIIFAACFGVAKLGRKRS